MYGIETIGETQVRASRAEPGAGAPPTLAVVIPANNEAAYIGPCLEALLASVLPVADGAVGAVGAAGAAGAAPKPVPPVEILVVANGCTDQTCATARAFEPAAAARGWRLRVVDLARPGKIDALNAADRIADGAVRIYLDADVVVGPHLLCALREALARPEPAYASGRVTIAPARSAVSRAYGRFWSHLPFVQLAAPGFGIFAVNAAGRARWGAFPDIVADDTFVRLNFAPSERTEVAASFTWPLVEGFAPLVRVRRRQDAGVVEVQRLFPRLMNNEDKPRMTARRALVLALRDPVGFGVYAAVIAATRLSRRRHLEWSRGR